MHERQPVLFLSHGSPLSALPGDDLRQTWVTLSERLARPKAILAVSAHWTTQVPMLSGHAHPETIHDFGGFPDALYRLRYAAPGAPDLAQAIKRQLTEAGLATGIDASRGLDHGAWVPLLALFPNAEIPVLQLSVQPERCARHHLALGTALANLPGEGVLVLASGHMTHNLRDFFRNNGKGPTPESATFREWAHERVMTHDREALLDWTGAAGAASAHPTPEHFLPLFVALGAAGNAPRTERVGGGWINGALAADSYLFAPA